MAVERSWRPSYLRRNLSRRRFLAGSAAAVGAAAIIACGGGGSRTVTLAPADAKKPGALFYERDSWRLQEETANAVPGGVYPGYFPADLNGTFDPYLNSNDAVRIFGNMVYEYLVTKTRWFGIQPGSPEALTVTPVLAQSWEVSQDGLTYTFKMRPNVKFQNLPPVNGRVMDIDDWRTSVERFFGPGTVYRANLASVFDKAEYPDANTMVWKLSSPYAPMLPRLDEVMFGIRIMPKELNANPEIAATTAVGTNYMIADKIQPSVTREFRQHPEYWGGKPFINRWHFPIIPEYSNQYAQFVGKNIVSFNPANVDALKMRQDAPEAVMLGSELPTAGSGFRIGNQVEGTPWKDVRVRYAMRRAIDWEKLTNFFANKDEFAKAGIDLETSYSAHLPSEPDFWLDPRKGELGPASQNYLYNEAEAQKLLTAAGYPDGFEFDFYDNRDVGASPTYTPAYYERHQVIMREYQRALGGGKFKPNMVLVPYREWVDRIIIQWPMKGFTISWSNGGDVDNVVYRLWHSSNKPAFPDPKLDEYAERQRRIADPVQRAAVLKELAKYLAEFFPSIPTHGSAASFGFEWPWVHNVYGRLAPNPQPVGVRGHLQWLDPNMPRRNG